MFYPDQLPEFGGIFRLGCVYLDMTVKEDFVKMINLVDKIGTKLCTVVLIGLLMGLTYNEIEEILMEQSKIKNKGLEVFMDD